MNLEIRRSFAKQESILSILGLNYDIAFTKCNLLQARSSDVYEIAAEGCFYILKIYPPYGIERTKIEFIDKITSLYFNFSYIIKNNSNENFIYFDYPEGDRIGVLYKFIPSYKYKKTDRFNKIGKELSQFHKIKTSEEYFSPSREEYFEDVIINSDLSNDSKYDLMTLNNRVLEFNKACLSDIPKGLCHGDFHPGNIIHTDSSFKIIDFDTIGIDYKIIDIASIIWANHFCMGVSDSDLVDFIDGYSIDAEINFIATHILKYFLRNIELKYLIHHLEKQDTTGRLFLNDNLVKSRLNALENFDSLYEKPALLKILKDYT